MLSDEKKRKVYDQVGLLLRPDRSGDGRGLCAAAGRAQRRRSTLTASIFPAFRAGRASKQGQQAGAGSASWGSFKDIFSGIFYRRAAAAAAARAAAGNRSRIPGDGRFLDGDSRRPGAHPGQQRQETCPTCHGQARTGGPMQCPECNGTGQVTQMGGRMKFNIPCPRCNGTGRTSNDLRHLPWRRAW